MSNIACVDYTRFEWRKRFAQYLMTFMKAGILVPQMDTLVSRLGYNLL